MVWCATESNAVEVWLPLPSPSPTRQLRPETQIQPHVAERYIDLMCQLKPEALDFFLRNNSHYRVEEALTVGGAAEGAWWWVAVRWGLAVMGGAAVHVLLMTGVTGHPDCGSPRAESGDCLPQGADGRL